jgi:DNA helicase-2/ATP-dependent DNA helicase PcrA
MKLSYQQRKAVEHMGSPALVVAGAGSGKTRTLTAKIAWLIDNGYDPQRILAITFTNKAADEMKNRLVDMTRLPLDRFPWVRTYHSACLMILKTHCDLLGYRLPLQVFAGYQQQKLLRDIVVGEMRMEKKNIAPVASHISHAKNSGDPLRYFNQNPYHYRIRLEEVYSRYEKELKKANAVDFDNILLMSRNLLRDHETVRQTYRKLFTYLLVDEYQDTNNLQEELTCLLLSDGNLFCVGDDWQAIYSFRGSNVSHFLTFAQKYKNAKIFRLEQNYRSADEIVRLSNKVIGNNDSRMEKECFSKKKGGLVQTQSFFDEEEEANWVLEKVAALKSGGMPYDRMAVLYRTKFSSLAFEQACRSAQVPYRMLGGKGFFERKEIMDINCYLSASVFEKDDASFERIINTPKRGIGPKTIARIAQSRSKDMSLQAAARRALADKIFTPKIYSGLKDVIGLLDAIKTMKPHLAVEKIIKKLKYYDYLKSYVQDNPMDFTARKENLEQLMYSASRMDTIVEYLEEASLVREDKADTKDDQSGLNLSTIHAAKGLEFEAVFVVACEEQLFPHWRSLQTDDGLEEERRLMYVSLTRAQRYLFVSSANYRKGLYYRPSRFMDEIEAAL